MASESFLRKLYFSVEERYYGAMSALQKAGIPTYKYYVVPIEKRGIPSFVVTAAVLLAIALAAYFSLSGGLSISLSGIPFGLGPAQAGNSTVRFVVQDSQQQGIDGAVVVLLDGTAVLGNQTTLGGQAIFSQLPAKLLYYKISRQGYKDVQGSFDSSTQASVLVVLQCSANCPQPSAVPSPSAFATPTPTPSPSGPPINKQSLAITLVDNRTKATLTVAAQVEVKDSVSLFTLASASTTSGVATVQVTPGASVIIEANGQGYQTTVTPTIVLTDSVLANGLTVALDPSTSPQATTHISVIDGNNNSLNATVNLFEKGDSVPFQTFDVGPGGYDVLLSSSTEWLLVANATGYDSYASPFFNAGDQVVAILQPLYNGTLQYCRVAISSSQVSVLQPVEVNVIYDGLAAPPKNVTLFCGTDAGEQQNLTTCLGTSGNCTSQCVYSKPGSKAIYAQIGDFNCLATQAAAINVTDVGPNCNIALNPQATQYNGSTTVTVNYYNLTSQPPNGVLDVTCGSGGASNVVEARGCYNTTGNCTTACHYGFTPAQVLDNPTRPVYVSYGGAQCIANVHFADTAASLSSSVVFLGNFLSNSRVGLYQWQPNVQGYYFVTSGVAQNGTVSFSHLVRGDTMRVDAADASGIMQGSSLATLDFPDNDVNVSVDLPPAWFNATAVDSATGTTTPQLSASNPIFSAYCNSISPDGTSYTSNYNLSSTCTAVNGTCTLGGHASVSCFVVGNATNYLDVSPTQAYRLSTNQTQQVVHQFTQCGQAGQACCGGSCSGSLVCSAGTCTAAAGATSSLSITGSSGVVSTSGQDVVMPIDPVVSADALPVSYALGPGCTSVISRISGDPSVTACFNDISYDSTAGRPPAALTFSSSAAGCGVKSTGLSIQSASATLYLRCGEGSQVSSVNLHLVGSTNPDAAGVAPSSLYSTGSASLVYVSNHKQFESQQLDAANGAVSPSGAIDNTPPTVALLEPQAGSAVTGPALLLANATDDVRVASVSFYVDGVLAGSANSTPYSMVWDTSYTPLGVHTVSATATDAAGNTATTQILVTKESDDVLASGIVGLGNLVAGRYFGFARGIGVQSATCSPYCDYADLPSGTATLPYAAFAPLVQKGWLAFQNSSGANLVYSASPNGHNLQLVPFTNMSLSSPLVFADNSSAYFHSNGALYRYDGATLKQLAALPSPPVSFSFDSNSIYVAYNSGGVGTIGRKAYSDTSNAFSTLASFSGTATSVAARDGWVYWLEQNPSLACRILATGVGAVSCAPYSLSTPNSLWADSQFLYFLDGSSLKRLSNDWSGYITLGTGLSGATAAASDGSSVYVSQVDPSTGKGLIKQFPKSP